MDIAIVGAGPTGLTAGYTLARRGHRVSLFEREQRYARLLDTVPFGDTRVEKFYHHLFTSDADCVNLIEDLKLSSRLSWYSSRNGMYINHALVPFASPADLLACRAFSLAERCKLAFFLLQARLITDWEKLDHCTAKQWVIRYSGEQLYRKMWGPLLESKFDRDADAISAAWLWSRIKLRSTTRRKTLLRERLGYMQGSFMLLYDTLASRIRECGGSIRCSQAVSRIVPHDDGSLEVFSTDGSKHYEAVILTAAPSAMLDMGLSLPAWYRETIAEIKYKAHICALLELARPLSPYYWITVADRECPFIAVVEHTNMLPAEKYGRHLVYLSRYVDETSDLFRSSDEQLGEQCINALTRLFPRWDRSNILKVQVNRARDVQPVICREYSRIIPPLTTPIDNLYLASMAQIYPEDRGQNYAIRMGKRIAALVDSTKNR